ncbi:hypothetical protein [Shimia biformata]|uniref:hypothetical protein n=1 Tax=Shimia biformata TaxID=1294299 RepID=UPI0019527304|nr:hypothetical protein [Shimia biformata]
MSDGFGASARGQKRGAAPVGFLSELGPVEQGAVRALRAWSDGRAGLENLGRDITRTAGVAHADMVLHALSNLCDLCARHGRRPLMRHHSACACLGADESCFAHFVAAAADGQREDAMLLATLLVRPDFAPSLVGLAEYLGNALRLAASVPPHTHHTDNVVKLH